MKSDKEKLRTLKDRYLRDPLPVRLGNLASNLSRLKSFAGNTALSEAARRVLVESEFFIEWAAADADLSLQVELLELQRTLARWQLGLDGIWEDSEKRRGLAEQAGRWSDLLLIRSGLIDGYVPVSLGGNRH